TRDAPADRLRVQPGGAGRRIDAGDILAVMGTRQGGEIQREDFAAVFTQLAVNGADAVVEPALDGNRNDAAAALLGGQPVVDAAAILVIDSDDRRIALALAGKDAGLDRGVGF